jgi:hypothetical protein
LSCIISRFVEDTTLAVDSERGAFWSFGRGLAHSCRGMVLKRAVRGVLASSLLHEDEPVRTTRGPTPLRRCIGAMRVYAFPLFYKYRPLCKWAAIVQFPRDSSASNIKHKQFEIANHRKHLFSAIKSSNPSF